MTNSRSKYADLDALIEAQAPLRPTGRLTSEDPCWCRSGQSYGICHQGRHLKPRPNGHQLSAQFRKIYSEGVCLHPHASAGSCSSSKPIKSHTLQRNGGLAAIAENGHVHATLVDYADLARASGKPGLKRIGIGRASTFPGFCALHDDGLFKSIEGVSVSIDQEAAFLFAYRAMSYELQRKISAIASTRLLSENADNGLPLNMQFGIQSNLAFYRIGSEIGLSDLKRIKSQYDAALLDGDFSSMQFLSIDFDEVLPIVVSSGCLPTDEFGGVSGTQDLLEMNGRIEHVTLTITSFGGKSKLVFAWLGSASGVSAKFVRSFFRAPKEHRASVLISAAFSLSENVFVRSSWWEQLAEPLQKWLLDRREDGLPTNPTADNWLTLDVQGYSDAVHGRVESSLPGYALWAY